MKLRSSLPVDDRGRASGVRPPRPLTPDDSPVAVIDIGSNSGRVVVLGRDATGHLRQLAGSRASLRLVSDVDKHHNLSEQSMARTMEALRDFRAIAAGSGAKRVVAFATAAMRDARNGRLFVERIRRELRIEIEIIDGKEEGRLGFAGAVRSLPVAGGLLFDLGGGSMQISHFSNRALDRVITLPLGALRISEMFLASDPPRSKEIRRLRKHVREQIAEAKAPTLTNGERLLGTGGTLRNLAKIDRNARGYPISRLHGYELSLKHLHGIVDRLVSMRHKERDEMSGLSADRADSIVGGALTIESLMEHVGASDILVSSHGVREGIALRLLKIAMAATKDVKETSLTSLAARFDGWNASAAARRRAVTAALLHALEPRADPKIAETLDHGARVLDIGRTLDFVARHDLAASVLLATELDGFSHEELALAAALLRRAGDRHADSRTFGVLIADADRPLLHRAAVILALGDAIEARCPRGRPITVGCIVAARVTISVPQLLSWQETELGQRFERAFGKPLTIVAGA
jgi:exopolyphosphatase/guanosine-5'-triphosphate,3'-diphosphate pyrophosphatase